MNFLAHLWLADRAALPLAGAILGDCLHGALPGEMPEPLAQSVRLHRRIDAATDRHRVVQAARERFGPGTRRYAGIVLDLLFDHVLAQDWTRYSAEALPDFADRAAADVAAARRWFVHAGRPVPRPIPFSALLVSYRDERALERAVERTAQRLRRPLGLIDAMAGWRGHIPRLRADLPELLADLRRLPGGTWTGDLVDSRRGATEG
jgi:acyl carrier protein phosphodiesterase